MKENSFETIRYIQTLNGTLGFEYRVRIWNEGRNKVPANGCSRTATELNLSCRQRKLFQPLSIGFENKANFSPLRHSACPR